MNNNLDIINFTNEECITYAKKIKSGEIPFSEIKDYLENFAKIDNYTEVDAIQIIKNITLFTFIVPCERIDFQTCCGKIMLNAAKFINTEGSLNFKILYALCMSQFNEDKTAINENWREEILMIILGRFAALVKDDKTYATNLMYKYNEIMESNTKLYVYHYNFNNVNDYDSELIKKN